MTKINRTREIFEGDTVNLVVSVEDSSGNAYNLAGVQEITFALARNENDTPIISKSQTDGEITVQDASGGTYQIKIEDGDTDGLSGQYYWDSEITASNDDVYTVAAGRFVIRPSLT